MVEIVWLVELVEGLNEEEICGMREREREREREKERERVSASASARCNGDGRHRKHLGQV